MISKRNIERMLPFYMALGICIFLLILSFDQIKLRRFDILISSTISISATTIGFIITIIAILIGLINEKVMDILRKNNTMKLLREYLIVPVILGFILIMLCSILVIIVGEEFIIEGVLLYTTVFILSSFVFSLVRLGIILYRIFGQVTDDFPKEKNNSVIIEAEKFFKD